MQDVAGDDPQDTQREGNLHTDIRQNAPVRGQGTGRAEVDTGSSEDPGDVEQAGDNTNIHTRPRTFLVEPLEQLDFGRR